MYRFLTYCIVLFLSTSLSGCTAYRFVEERYFMPKIASEEGMANLPSVQALNNQQLVDMCHLTASNNAIAPSDFALVLQVYCAAELLQRKQLSPAHSADALQIYNTGLYTLMKAHQQGLFTDERITVEYNTSVPFTFSLDLAAVDPRLQPRIFGELGVAVVTRRTNQQQGLDLFQPLEGIYRSANVTLKQIKLVDDDSYVIRLHLAPVDKAKATYMGNNAFIKKYSPASAFLSLIENADIDDFNWLGFVTAAEAEKRRGVFVIGEPSMTKVPLVMIHGLNSDPLIWRHMTQAFLNDAELLERYQIWHVYYPSGPPPFYNAARTRSDLHELLGALGSPELYERAVIIGHSMGGLVAKLLSTESGYALWDATFKVRPDYIVESENSDLQDIFMYQPVFQHNTVFFLDTPFKGSDVANSAIGVLGNMLVTLPEQFTNVFKRFFDRVGVDILTSKMRPYLINNGPSSVHVLRPGHPLMDALYQFKVVGESYAVIGSNGDLDCTDVLTCELISDGVVSFNSAHYPHARAEKIVYSQHNSFQSNDAIEFITDIIRELNSEAL